MSDTSNVAIDQAAAEKTALSERRKALFTQAAIIIAIVAIMTSTLLHRSTQTNTAPLVEQSNHLNHEQVLLAHQLKGLVKRVDHVADQINSCVTPHHKCYEAQI